jgi:hypothetical protein
MNSLGLPGLEVLDGEPFEMAFALSADHRSIGSDLHIPEPANAVHQVLGHGLLEGVLQGEDEDTAGVLSQQ